jgi:hypothetical protein
MQHPSRVTVGESCEYLSKDSTSHIFFQAASLSDIIEKVTSSAELHHENDVLSAIKVLVESHDVFVAYLPQDHNLLHHSLGMRVLLLLRALDLQVLFVDRLNGHKFLRQPMQGKVHFPEGAFPEDFPNSVAFQGCDERTEWIRQECLFNSLLQAFAIHLLSGTAGLFDYGGGFLQLKLKLLVQFLGRLEFQIGRRDIW